MPNLMIKQLYIRSIVHAAHCEIIHFFNYKQKMIRFSQ